MAEKKMGLFNGFAREMLGHPARNAVQLVGFDVFRHVQNRILDDAGILTSATAGVPVRLRVARLHFSGTKQLHPDGDGGAVGGTPFAFDWDIPAGVSGIGSGANLRGKSSVLNVLQWALTGRCGLQEDVKSWLDRVEVEWLIDDARIEVAFAVTDMVPAGEVVLIKDNNGATRRTPLGTFGSEQDFQVLMGKLMMDRLRLDPIAMWTATQETSHRWPAYASALSIQANKLDPLIGNEGVLASRMLQMFAGTSWATPGSQAATASRGLAFEAERAKEKASAATEVTAAARAAAEARVAAARTHFESFSAADPDVSTMLGLTAAAHDLAQKAHQVELKLNTAKTAAAQVQDQLKSERVRQNGLMEDALARLFFNSMEPTVCPRCAAAVTEERKKAEPEQHSCSVCSHDLDLSALAGSGSGGAVVASDVEASRSDVSRAAPVSAVWGLMAKRTTESWQSVPHFYLRREVDASRLESWRTIARATPGQERVSHTDLLVKLVAEALCRHPRVNSTWRDGAVVPMERVGVGIAVAIDDGLVVPVVHDADRLSLAKVAARRIELVEAARGGRLRPDDVTGGTFTVSNLGMYGVDSFDAIVNAPQAAILAVGRIVDRIVPVDGQPAVRPVLNLSVSFDHRVVDGARGAEFLETLASLVEEPAGLVG